jgi:flavin reductase (DIM6/NTAB) family NADH-FMN oxidoreductase RutF
MSNPNLARALGRVASGLFVVTARLEPGETGMLASWVQQCSFDPPQLSLALGRDRTLAAGLALGSRFTVNILGEGQTRYLSHFGKGFAAGAPAFEGLEVLRPLEDAIVLADALAWLACELTGRCAAGDHDLLIGRILDGNLLSEARPMIHVRKNGLRY